MQEYRSPTLSYHLVAAYVPINTFRIHSSHYSSSRQSIQIYSQGEHLLWGQGHTEQRELNHTHDCHSMERAVHSICCTRVILLILAQRTKYKDRTPSSRDTSSRLERCPPHTRGTAPVFSTVISTGDSLGDELYEIDSLNQEPAAPPLDWIHWK